MTEQAQQTPDFFYADGTMRPNTPSYVVRPADQALLKCALDGKLAYVLTARQMGKSSLMIRTAAKLDEMGVKTAIVDLNAIGTATVVEQWYLGVAKSISEELNLAIDLLQWWQSQIEMGPVKCFTSFLRDVVLTEIKEKIVVFVDEIDSTLNLTFADDFFAAIRAAYNARSRDPVYSRLTFVLIGVATPSDLIHDEKRTPFNIGQAIELQDFNRDDAIVLEKGLEQLNLQQAKQILDRILYWTAGHPYLTQKLCIAITEDVATQWDEAQVDKLVHKLFLSSNAAEDEDNLQFVQKNIFSSSRKRELLQLYQRVYGGEPPQNDDRDLLQNQLKLIGLIRPRDRVLSVRNLIYQSVFDGKWITENMPPLPNRSRYLVGALVATIIVLLLGIFVPIQLDRRVPWNPNYIQAQTLRENVLNTTSADAQITNLARLIERGYADIAYATFMDQLTLAQQLALFKNSNIDQVALDTISVADLVYDSVSADVRIAILAKLFESNGYKEEAVAFLFDRLSSSEQVELFRAADVQTVGPQIVTVFKAIAHSGSADVRFAALARIFQIEDQSANPTELFFTELSVEERVVLFQNAEPKIVDAELLTVAKAIYSRLDNTPNNNKLLEVIADSLHRVYRPAASDLATIIETWLNGRDAYESGTKAKEQAVALASFTAALTSLNLVLEFNSQNPEAYFDRALVYLATTSYDETLADLSVALSLTGQIASRIRSTFYANPLLADTWVEEGQQYANLRTVATLAGTWISSSVVQVISQTTATITFDFIDQRGLSVCDKSFSLPPGYSLEVTLQNIVECSAGFIGSSVVSASQPAAAVSTDSGSLSLSNERLLKKYAINGFPTGFNELFFPNLNSGPDAIRLSANIQNATVNMSKSTIYLLDRKGQIIAQKTYTIPGQGSQAINLFEIYDDVPTPEQWSGAIRIVVDDGLISASTVYCYRFFCVGDTGQSTGARHWFVPALAKTDSSADAATAISSFAVMNTSATEQTAVTITFQGSAAGKTVTLPPLGSIEISTQELDGLPLTSTAEVSSANTDIVVNAQYVNHAANQGAGYQGLAVEFGSREIFFPDVSWAEDRQADTTIYLQNLANAENSPVLFLYDRVINSDDDLAAPIEVPLGKMPPYATLAIDIEQYLGDRADSHWEGSVAIKGGEVMGGVIITRADGAEQWATAYNAVPGE